MSGSTRDGGAPDDAPFMARWSRRKREAAAENAAAAAQPAAAGPDPEAELAALPDDEALEKLGLPDPDAMSAGDDFSAFMKSGVPTRLRNRALRKLWLSNAALANLDELVDYGEDFTDAATVVDQLQTVYEVGRGMFARDPDPDPEPDPDAPPPQDAADGVAADATRGRVEIAASDQDAAANSSDAASLVSTSSPITDRFVDDAGLWERSPSDTAHFDALTPSPRRRRMAFVFEGDD